MNNRIIAPINGKSPEFCSTLIPARKQIIRAIWCQLICIMLLLEFIDGSDQKKQSILSFWVPLLAPNKLGTLFLAIRCCVACFKNQVCVVCASGIFFQQVNVQTVLREKLLRLWSSFILVDQNAICTKGTLVLSCMCVSPLFL